MRFYLLAIFMLIRRCVSGRQTNRRSNEQKIESGFGNLLSFSVLLPFCTTAFCLSSEN